jgi:hypothetical protein
MTAKMLHFAHRFPDSLVLGLEIQDTQPKPGTPITPAINWRGTPKPEHFGEYRSWILFAFRELATRWQSSILYALQSGPTDAELRVFNPGQAPRLELAFTVEKMPV